GVGATAAALVDLSTVAGNKISNPPWVKFQSAGWVNFPSAPTVLVLEELCPRDFVCLNQLAVIGCVFLLENFPIENDVRLKNSQVLA
ncbi:hypothetical protein JTL77_33945, partial [Pseudomonas aeruginosa]|nr:hypothetical protein [Pseudomonas aeruginosa]